MRISKIENFYVKDGISNLCFLKITADNGIVGWSEYVNGPDKTEVTDSICRITGIFIGADPRAIGRISYEFDTIRNGSVGSVNRYALSAIENACLEITAKAAGVPVYGLFGGPLRKKIPVCLELGGWDGIRLLNNDLDGPRSMNRTHQCHLAKVSLENVTKTVSCISKDKLPEGRSELHTIYFYQLKESISKIISSAKEKLPPQTSLALDLGSLCQADVIRRLFKEIKSWKLEWLEINSLNCDLLALIRSSIDCPLSSLKSIHGLTNYQPYLKNYSVDIAVIDAFANGIWESLRIASLADSYDVNVSLKSGSGHLLDLINAHLCAMIPNLRTMDINFRQRSHEISLFSNPIEFKNGELVLPDLPGWGIEVNEQALDAFVP